ncbi:hypothetical protein LVJ94_10540 [Pendulispora rubella]|uniref:Uncharacterized protein n=1 Tax=Pendulispora rubella TaxID=2741070 RepID=A0ABZ2L9W0_9BACT
MPLAVYGCASGGSVDGEGPETGNGGGFVPGGDAGPDAKAPVDTTPYKITAATATLSGMTSDGYAVYHTADGLYAVAAKPASAPVRITTNSAIAVVRGPVVFAYTNVNYTNNTGTLTVWSAAGGVKLVGPTLLSDDMVAATDDGGQILFTADVTASTASLNIASSRTPDKRQTLVPAMGRGSATTCRPRFGFAGQRAIAVWCANGSQSATLARYEAPATAAATWTASSIASDVQPAWVADAQGDRVFFVTNNSRGMIADTNGVVLVDNGVTWATFADNGNSLLYTVNDQLRRTSLPAVNPTPVVTVGFAARAPFSPNYAFALYSTVVTYDGGEHRDLYLASTSKLNPAPDKLVEGANGQLSRSAFTDDSSNVLYLTDIKPDRGTLNARPVAGGTARKFPDVDSVLAATGSTIVFSDNRSDPQAYPVTSDVKVVNLATGQAPFLLRAKVLDGRTVQLTPQRDKIVYAIPRGEGEQGAADEGLWVQAIP